MNQVKYVSLVGGPDAERRLTQVRGEASQVAEQVAKIGLGK